MRKLISLLIAAGSISVLAGCESGEHEPYIPDSMIGDWHQVSGLDGVYMIATIGEESIQVDMRSNTGYKPYWMGTFDTGMDTSKPFKYTSIGDSDALALSIFGSRDKRKNFSYKDGVLSYEFSMLNGAQKATVKLVKDEKPTPVATETVYVDDDVRVIPNYTRKPTKRATAPVNAAPNHKPYKPSSPRRR